MIPIRDTVHLSNALVLLILGFATCWFVVSGVLFVRWESRRIRASCIVLIALISAVTLPVFIYLQRNSGLGILAFGGARFWIQKAAASESQLEEATHLWYVLTSSNKGHVAAEKAVLSLSTPADRCRLFSRLAQITPIDHWREKYERHKDHEERNLAGAGR
jgi:hypothetical protein